MKILQGSVGEALEVLSADAQGVEELSLNGVRMGDQAGELAAALGRATSLRKLVLTANRLSSVDVTLIISALQNHPSVVEFDLSCNQLSVAAVHRTLAGFLSANSVLTTLRLDSTRIGGGGAGFLAVGLATNSTLTCLGLRFNELGNDGARHIARALEQNKALRVLQMQFNEITADGAKALAAALSKNTALTELELTANEFGDEGGEALAAALEDNTVLADLDVFGCDLSPGCQERINTLLSRNSQLSASPLRCLVGLPCCAARR